MSRNTTLRASQLAYDEAGDFLLVNPDVVEFEDVEVVGDTGLTLVCVVNGRRVMIPPLQLDRRSLVRRVGDRGLLVIPRWLAIDLGLA